MKKLKFSILFGLIILILGCFILDVFTGETKTEWGTIQDYSFEPGHWEKKCNTNSKGQETCKQEWDDADCEVYIVAESWQGWLESSCLFVPEKGQKIKLAWRDGGITKFKWGVSYDSN